MNDGAFYIASQEIGSIGDAVCLKLLCEQPLIIRNSALEVTE